MGKSKWFEKIPKEEELVEVTGDKYLGNSSRDLPEPPFGYYYYNGKLYKNQRVNAYGGGNQRVYKDKYGMPKLYPISGESWNNEAFKEQQNRLNDRLRRLNVGANSMGLKMKGDRLREQELPMINVSGGFRPMTQKQFYSLSPKHQKHHIQLAHRHHLAGGKVPNWLKKIGNFAKDVGHKIKDTALKIGENPTMQKIGRVAKDVGKTIKSTYLQIQNNPIAQRLGREALYLIAPPLRFADPAIKIVQEHATNELVKELGEEGRADLEGRGRRRKLKGGAENELFARLREMITDASRSGITITKKWVKEKALPYFKKRGEELGEKATTAILEWARSVQYGNEIDVPDIGADWEDVEEEPDYDFVDEFGGGRSPYNNLKKGAFTKECKAFNKKHGKNVDLEGFAKIIAHSPEHFKPITRKRALFYLNLIKHKPTHLKGGLDFSKSLDYSKPLDFSKGYFSMEENNKRREATERRKKKDAEEKEAELKYNTRHFGGYKIL